MKPIVISYSLTGNNQALATSIATELSAEHIKINEPKPRSGGTIFFDILFNRTPKVTPVLDRMPDNDLIIFVGPVWMGNVATPLRAYFQLLIDKLGQYAFVSISGGASGPNPKLASELKKRTGKEPTALIDLHIADLLPKDPKPTRKDTQSYHLTDRDVKNLTDKVVKTLRESIIK
jgi:hypothetical protein